jgi:hypothetical protein
MGKFNWGMRACGALLLWAATAITLPAQTMASVPPVQTPLVAPRVTFTTLFSFDDYANGPYFPAELIQNHRWSLVRDNVLWRESHLQPTVWLWHGLPHHRKRQVDDAAQLRPRGRLGSRRRSGPKHRWKLVRANGRGRDQQRLQPGRWLWHGLQNDPRRNANHVA